MARKSAKFEGVNLTCDKCGVKANTVPGSKHRRCGGGEGAQPTEKHNKKAREDRGNWK